MKNFLKNIIIIGLIVIFSYFISICILKHFVYPLTHFDTVKEAANENNIDPYLILAIIKTESGFNETATSSKKARGLMQILDSTATDVNDSINLVDNIDENIYDIDVNIKLGCKYFANLMSKYDGNYYLAICAYNAGMGNVDKWIEEDKVSRNLNEYKNVEIPFDETAKYLNKVVSSYRVYRWLYK